MAKLPSNSVTPRHRRTPKQDLTPYCVAVNEASKRSRTLWFGYIALLAYLFVTVGAVTHMDLLLQSPVKLPVLNVKLPLTGFFAVAPVFLILNHFYLLLNLLGLSRRIGEYNAALRAAGVPARPEQLERRRLDTFVIVQILGGTFEERSGKTGKYLYVIALSTIVIAPVLLLLFIQLQFLPFQSESLSWMHRLALLVDLVLIWIFWPAILKHDWDRSKRPFLARLATLCVSVFSIFIATFPGEIADGGINASSWSTHKDSSFWWVKGPLFGRIAPLELKTDAIGIPFLARTISLPLERNLINQDTFERIRTRYRSNGSTQDTWYLQQEPWESQRTHSFRNRNLRGAIFEKSDLRNIDFENADLRGASFAKASLQGASLVGANLEGASMAFANLRGASLEKANLQRSQFFATNLERASLIAADAKNADFATANLSFTSLEQANLLEVNLASTNLKGANLDGASLQNTSLVYANLIDSSFVEASLQNSIFDNANLAGATIKFASAQGASFREANLNGAILDFSSLQGASFDFAALQAASMFRSKLHASSFNYANLSGAILDFAHLQGASFNFATLSGASLNNTNLRGASLQYAILRGTSFLSSLLWRTSGVPVVRDPQSLQVKHPNFTSIDTREYSDLLRDAMDGVIGDDKRNHVYENLRRLCSLTAGCPKQDFEWLGTEFWETFADRHNAREFKKALSETLYEIVCQSEEGSERLHIVQGLASAPVDSTPKILSRLETLGPNHLPSLAKRLSTAAGSATHLCPSLEGLQKETKNKLWYWANHPPEARLFDEVRR